MSQQLKSRIESLGLVLPPAPKPAGVYKPILILEQSFICFGSRASAQRWRIN